MAPMIGIKERRQAVVKAELWLLGVVVVWGANYPLAKYGLTGLNEFVFNSIRYLVATAVLAVPFAFGARWVRIAAADRPKILATGIIANVVYQVMFIVGLSLTTAGNAAVILSTSPLWTTYFSSRLHKEQIDSQVWTGMTISLLGIIMIIVGSGKKLALGGHELIGDCIVFVAASLWGLTTNMQKPLLMRYSPTQIAFSLVGIGGIGLAAIATPVAATYSWGDVHWTYYLAAILSGAFSIGIANNIWSRGVQQLGPSRTSNFNNLVPILAFVISFLTLNEQLLPIQIVGAGVTITGVWIARR
jgi:drug/metabolite transporter (DMT)-like permease